MERWSRSRSASIGTTNEECERAPPGPGSDGSSTTRRGSASNDRAAPERSWGPRRTRSVMPTARIADTGDRRSTRRTPTVRTDHRGIEPALGIVAGSRTARMPGRITAEREERRTGGRTKERRRHPDRARPGRDDGDARNDEGNDRDERRSGEGGPGAAPGRAAERASGRSRTPRRSPMACLSATGSEGVQRGHGPLDRFFAQQKGRRVSLKPLLPSSSLSGHDWRSKGGRRDPRRCRLDPYQRPGSRSTPQNGEPWQAARSCRSTAAGARGRPFGVRQPRSGRCLRSSRRRRPTLRTGAKALPARIHPMAGRDGADRGGQEAHARSRHRLHPAGLRRRRRVRRAPRPGQGGASTASTSSSRPATRRRPRPDPCLGSA